MKTKTEKRREKLARAAFSAAILLTCALAWAAPQTAEAATIYVKVGATGANNGASWANAFKSLQDGLAAAVAGDAIWVAAGTYKPDQGAGITPGDTAASFKLKDQVVLYGGFSGNETDLRQRNLQVNKAILSGDLSGNDRTYFVHYEENSAVVVQAVSEGTLDGFTVNGARTAGISCSYDPDPYSYPYPVDGKMTIRNCLVEKNLGTGFSAIGLPSWSNYGGASVRRAYASISNCIFRNNVDLGLAYGGGAFISYSSVDITHCTFMNNATGYEGGALYLHSSVVPIANSIVWHNFPAYGQVVVKNEMYFYSYVTVVNSDIQGLNAIASLSTNLNNIDADPLLTADGRLRAGSPCIDAGDPLKATPNDLDGEARPYGAAPDMGADEFIDADADTLPDIWETRWFGNLNQGGLADTDNDGLNNGAEYQVGTSPMRADTDSDGFTDAAELQALAEPADPASFPDRLYVKWDAAGSNTGLSWANAFTSLQDAMAVAHAGTDIWIAAGVYKPDQGKGITPGDTLASFQLRPGMTIHGGFAGTENLLSNRDWRENNTILSGDLSVNDGPFFSHYEENSFRVVTANTYFSPGQTAILDGVTISHANAAKNPSPFILGDAGLSFRDASPIIRNCTISENNTLGILATGGSPIFENCIIKENSVGGMRLGGSDTRITHCTFTANHYVAVSSQNSSLRITNSILWGNKGSNDFQLVSAGSNLTVLASDIQGGQNGIQSDTLAVLQDVINADPLLTRDGHLRSGSPCIDSGSPDFAMANDIDNEPRPYGARPDMGADEFIDMDRDSLADVWEILWFGNLKNTGAGDADSDGLNQLTEYENGTNPANPDTDGDGASDLRELEENTDPLDARYYPSWIYVNGMASGANNGTSWTNAFRSLQDALAVAEIGARIWVAAGVYRPDQGTGITAGDRTRQFSLKNGVALYGGFSGHEGKLSERNWTMNKTILSGDLLGDDKPGFVNQADNSTKVVVGRPFTQADGTIHDVVLDGFTVSGGNDTAGGYGAGAGLTIDAYSFDIQVVHCTFENNQSWEHGGAVSAYGVTFTDCLFRNNQAAGYGGALSGGNLLVRESIFSNNTAWNYGGAIHGSEIVLEHCQIKNNYGRNYGGGLYSEGKIKTINCIIDANKTDGAGGGIYYSGDLTAINTLIRNNTAVIGAGVRVGGAAEIIHSVISGNTATTSGGGVTMTASAMAAAMTLTNSIVWGNTAPSGPQIDLASGRITMTYNDIQGGLASIFVGTTATFTYLNNIEKDPLLTASGHLSSTSPCINAADPASTVTFDMDGETRPFGSGFDIGADEYGDRDGDGYTANEGDCNDADPSVYPGAPERCDGVDNNCNGQVDEGFDKDYDGFTTCGGDCNDANPAINPTATEVCDGVDNNCNGLIDDADPAAILLTWYADADADGYGDPRVTKKVCKQPVGFVTNAADCNDANPAVKPSAPEICTDAIDNNCNGLADLADPACANITPVACVYDAQCGTNWYCKKALGDCGGVGTCQPLPPAGTICPPIAGTICGCDGKDYANNCMAEVSGINVAANGVCATSGYKWTYYFPAVKDNDAIGWENYLSVQAKDPVAMDVTIRAYEMGGALKGTYVYSNTTGANAPSIAPNARVAQRPSWIAGSMTAPVAIEGSLVVETSVPAIASTNFIANFYKGFSIYEAAKVRPVHYFPKAFDGPNNFQVYMLAQNIYDTPRNVTVKLFGKVAGDPGDGVTRTVNIPAHGTLKVRPSEIAGGIDFNGSVVVYSNLTASEDGLGLPIPAMCSYEAGTEALAIYESAARQLQLAFPVLKDGKFGGALDYQNFLSVVNMNPQDATITMILYNKAGVEEGRLANDVIPSGGKKTWRPGWIKGTMAAPLDFEGSAIVTSDKMLIGQTNTIYPGANKYGADAFDLIESAMPTPSLIFPKAFDNLLGSGTGATHLIDNFVYVQNLDGTAKSLKIEQFNNNGTANGYAEVALAPNATHVFRPKDLVTDGTGAFRGSVRVTERGGKKITGAIKYEVHKTTAATSGIEAMSIYRSMGM